MKYYFYCPHCGLEQEELRSEDLPKNKVGNLRDGFGRPIYHYECRICGNLDAGAMAVESDTDSDGWQKYYRSVIEMYQGIRGFAKR